MKKAVSKNLIIIIFLLICVISTTILCAVRGGIEAMDKTASVVMAQSDVEILAEKQGITYDECSSKLTSSGIFIIENPSEVDEELNLFLGETYTGEHATIGLIEDENQYSFVPIEGFEYTGNSDVVRVFKFIPKFAERYAYLGYEGAEELENIAYRAITDRNIRVLWLTPFVHSENGGIISDPDEYTELVSSLEARLEQHGINLGKFTTISEYSPNMVLIFGVIAGISAGGVLLIHSLFNLSDKSKIILTVIVWFGAMGVQMIMPSAVALAASIVFPCLAIWFVADFLVKMEVSQSKLRAVLSYIIAVLIGFSIAVFGGFVVGALNSSREFLLAIDNFSGVKVSQFVPIAYAFLICLKLFYKGKNFGEVFSDYAKNKAVLITLFIATVAIVAVFLLRTGDGILTVSTLEQQFRNWLEYVLIARPRSKEFLFAYPALALAVTFLAYKNKRFAMPFTALTVVGFSSVVNTFCHSRAPLWLSFSRSGIGLLIGVSIGVIAILVLVHGRKKQKN